MIRYIVQRLSLKKIFRELEHLYLEEHGEIGLKNCDVNVIKRKAAKHMRLYMEG